MKAGVHYPGSTRADTFLLINGVNGGGNIDADPRFVDRAMQVLHLEIRSPVIDAGDNSSIPGVTTDLDGTPRKVDVPGVPDTGFGAAPLVDMGAYEAQYWGVFLPFTLK